MPPRGNAALWPLRILTDFGKAEYILSRLPRPGRRCRDFAAVQGSAPFAANRLWYAGSVPVRGCCDTSSCRRPYQGCGRRGRPFVGGEANAFNFSHFDWTSAHASFPSGHAIASFAFAFAIAALWPRMRAVVMVYAFVIAVTRLILLAHHPSDVIAGGLLGVVGAMFVRYWFAARHLCFSIDPQGTVKPLGGPSGNISKGLPGALSRHKKRTPRYQFSAVLTSGPIGR